MEIGTLVIILFVLAPLLEKLLKAGKQQPPVPPQRRPGQVERPQREPVARPRPRAAEQGSGEAGSAADMLPEDLWAILTGERRPAPQSRPAPADLPTPQPRAQLPAPARRAPPKPAREERPERGQPSAERAPLRRPAPTPGPRNESWDDAAEQAQLPARREEYRRPVTVHEVPSVVSLEPTMVDDVARHDSFHDRLTKMKAADAARLQAAAPVEHFTKHENWRRAMIMAEILGPPKSLEQPGSVLDSHGRLR